MSESSTSQVGTIGWFDLSVPDAGKVRDFYRDVVGWETSDVPMGDYNDYCMHPAPGADPVAGVCWKKGPNADLPSQWIMYITVEDLDRSIKAVRGGEGEVLIGPKGMGSMGKYAVIRDPAGAVCALFEPAA